MAGQQRAMEGNADQRRKAAREAKAQGKKPSEMSATTGASKQRGHKAGNKKGDNRRGANRTR